MKQLFNQEEGEENWKRTFKGSQSSFLQAPLCYTFILPNETFFFSISKQLWNFFIEKLCHHLHEIYSQGLCAFVNVKTWGWKSFKNWILSISWFFNATSDYACLNTFFPLCATKFSTRHCFDIFAHTHIHNVCIDWIGWERVSDWKRDWNHFVFLSHLWLCAPFLYFEKLLIQKSILYLLTSVFTVLCL